MTTKEKKTAITFKVELKNIKTGEALCYFVDEVGFPAAMDTAFKNLEEDHSFFDWYITSVSIPHALRQLRAL